MNVITLAILGIVGVVALWWLEIWEFLECAFDSRRRRLDEATIGLLLARDKLQKIQEDLLRLDDAAHSYSDEWQHSVLDWRLRTEKIMIEKVGCGSTIIFWGKRYKLLKQATRMLKKANFLVKQGERLVALSAARRNNSTIDLLQHRPRNIVLPLTLHYMGCMASYEMKVLDFVAEHKTVGAASLLGIFGMRGVGKTTLLRFVRDSYAQQVSSFSHVFFVGAGTGCTVGRLQHVLSGNISRPPLSDAPWPKTAISQYLVGISFLLLLDDVRERLDLAAVGLPMPLGHMQKVIFTTRNQAVCGEMGCTSDTSIQMECLGEDDAWSLFKDEVGAEIIDAHPHIKHIAKKMSAECRGLPSALCALGRAMSTKRDVKEWRYAYATLKRKMMKQRPPVDEIQEMDEDDGEAYSHLHALVDELQDSAFF